MRLQVEMYLCKVYDVDSEEVEEILAAVNQSPTEFIKDADTMQVDHVVLT